MSSNVDMFRRTVEYLVAGDVESVVASVHSDAVLEPLRAATEGAYVGHDGARRFIADTMQAFDLFAPTYREIRDLGDERVLALGSVRAKGRNSQVEVDVPTAVVAEYREGLLWRYRDYGDTEKALEAAGLAG